MSEVSGVWFSLAVLYFCSLIKVRLAESILFWLYFVHQVIHILCSSTCCSCCPVGYSFTLTWDILLHRCCFSDQTLLNSEIAPPPLTSSIISSIVSILYINFEDLMNCEDSISSNVLLKIEKEKEKTLKIP